ncbi:MAG TPA: GntR family transcriptional regulator [Clostridiales bacterium]|nr:GntR family transcriptional regulator [Clostridiales bacterium]
MLRFVNNGEDRTATSLGAKIFKQLQNDILNGKYEPGDILTEMKLSEELGVSRTPIREALKQLELEGLVKSTPGRGVVVQGITDKDIEDIYTIRMMIEGLAARWAAEKITPGELEELKEILEFEEFYTLKGGGTGNLLKLDSRFHDLVFKASKSRPLMHILSTFHHYVQSARSASLETPGRAQKVFEEHRAILQAINARDPDLAEKLTTEHVKNANINLMKKRSEQEHKQE